jgi:hypothetical protein
MRMGGEIRHGVEVTAAMPAALSRAPNAARDRAGKLLADDAIDIRPVGDGRAMLEKRGRRQLRPAGMSRHSEAHSRSF